MSQPSDATFEIVRSAQQSAMRALIAMEEAGKAMHSRLASYHKFVLG